MKQKEESILNIRSRVCKNGISIHIQGKDYTIEYPQFVWSSLSMYTKNMLCDNIVFAATHFLSMILKKDALAYDTNMPVCEPFMFRNHMADILDTERVDRVPFQSYMKKLYNTSYYFADEQALLPEPQTRRMTKKASPVVIVPFTFGKESMLSAAMAQSVGMRPVLVYVEDPMEKYEKDYKLQRLDEIGKQLNCPVHYIKNKAGLFRGGLAFNKHTDIGWGVQTTLYTLMCLPFVYHYQAQHILYGSEYSNNEWEYNTQGWKVHHSYDQTIFWTKAQSTLVRILSGGLCSVHSMLEPLEEPNIFYLLHSMYPEFGRQQFSCRAEKPLVKGSQWCHACYKCARMYAFSLAFGVDPASIGFKKNLLTRHMFADYLSSSLESGDPKDLDFAFYTILQQGVHGEVMELFKKKRLPYMKSWSWYVDYFTGLQSSHNLPSAYRHRLLVTYTKGLTQFRAYLKNIDAQGNNANEVCVLPLAFQ